MGQTTKTWKIGEKFINNNGESLEIINYISANNVTIKFSDGTIVYNRRYSHLQIGSVKNPNKKILYNLGYVGNGKYNTNKDIIIFTAWEKIFNRCYDIKYQKLKPTYMGCSVDERWYNFQVFAEWYDENYIFGWKIDKDILIKGNKIYGPDTCCFVPHEINSTIYTEINKTNGLPKGINFATDRGKYRIKIGINNNQIYLGQTDTIEEAKLIFSKAKEERIKELAYQYKNDLKENVFNTLINWKWDK